MSGAGASLSERVLRAGRDAGLAEVGICGAEPFDDTRRILEERRAEGLHGGMQFTYRNPARSTDPSVTLSGAASLVVGALHYAQSPPPRPAGAAGRVARYATADHYDRLRVALDAAADVLRAEGHRAVVVADQNNLVDRAVAVRAGLGWSGKSSNVLLVGRGSWFVLGSVVTDAVLAPSGGPVADGCGACSRCIQGCPTQAIVAPGVVDARRCLAWHLQVEGPFPHEFREALGDRIYGCDECQEVCPPARRDEARSTLDDHAHDHDHDDIAHATVLGDTVLGDAAGDGAADEPADGPADPGAGAPGSWVELDWILTATDDELMDRLGRWYVPRRDPRYLRRNALVAYGNSAEPDDASVGHLLGAFLSGVDEMLAAHAAWAALRLGRDDLLADEAVATRPEVRDEVERWLGVSRRGEDGGR
jgi:epoxyqueuosine reductase